MRRQCKNPRRGDMIIEISRFGTSDPRKGDMFEGSRSSSAIINNATPSGF
jgi:hypothetical protein